MTAETLTPTSPRPAGSAQQRLAPLARKPRTWKKPKTVGEWIVLSVCTIATIGMLVPVYVIITTALSGSTGAPNFFLAFPDAPSLDAFKGAWTKLHGSLLNSLQITVPAALISCLLGSINGYVLSKFPFKGSTALFTVLLVGMFIPFQAVIIPVFQFLNMLNLQGSIFGLIVVHVIYGIPITTLIFRNYYEGIPSAIVEAAAIDGAGIWKTYLRVMLPLSVPGFVVAGIFQCTNIWNDFLFGFILASPAAWPATVTLNNLIGTTTVDYSELMAGAVLVALPTVVLYLVLGRFFVSGLTAGAVK
ncbi:carbohydrate ABC transporter permease [Arthrobacter sp. 754]|uniref:carbohydrate ABC transporter permease n=1 Tax=Arthrobacter sp. 754 TaxID=3156315 RepID=UPI003399B1AF